MIRLLVAPVLCSLYVAAGLAPVSAQAQEPGVTPSTTQSQSGYPDIRKEAADPTLFPNPDETARNSVRPETSPNSRGAKNARSSNGKRVSNARANDRTLVQSDSDPLPIRVAYRRAKTIALARNPELRALLVRSDLARTDAEKRRFLRVYYTELFTEIHQIDRSPAMSSHLKALSSFAEQRFDPKRRAVAGEEDLIYGQPVSLSHGP